MVKATLRSGAKTAPVVDVEEAPAKETSDLTTILPGSAAQPEPVTAVARRATPAMTVARVTGAEDEDGFDESDNKYPVLRIVAGSGKLSQMFNVGSLILGPTIDEAEQLFGPPDPRGQTTHVLRFVPIGLRKAYRENLSQEDSEEGIMPRFYRTRAEVEDAGGTTQWIDREPPTFKPTATCIMLIEKPAGSDSPLFQTELDGKFYCPAVYYASNSAYKAFAVTLHNTARTTLLIPVLDAAGQPKKDDRGFVVKRKYYPKHPWTYQVKQTVKTKDGKQFTVFVPEIRVQAKEETGPELRAFVEQIAPSNTATADAEE